MFWKGLAVVCWLMACVAVGVGIGGLAVILLASKVMGL